MSLISHWRITGLVAIVIAVMSFTSFVWLGFSEEALRVMVRGTARTSISLFVLAFTASSLYTLLGTNWAKYLRENRRYIGVSFAFSHFVHLLFLILLMIYYPQDSLAKLSQLEIVLASMTYLFILAMAITSFDPPRRWIGPRAWHWLHLTGMYLVWLIFVETYGKAALQDGYYLPLVVLLLTAIMLRVAARLKQDKANH
jgi:sulfoxide reductase heme-binding subunit YedZ